MKTAGGANGNVSIDTAYNANIMSIKYTQLREVLYECIV